MIIDNSEFVLPNEAVICDPNRRHDVCFLFSAHNCNPNGDPDSDNKPRMNAHGYGLVTDGAIKRKIRNMQQVLLEGAEGQEVYVKKAPALCQNVRDAFGVKAADKKVYTDSEKVAAAMKYLQAHYADVRIFGGVINDTGLSHGLRGGITFAPAESVAPINPQMLGITRCAVSSEAEREKGDGTMGRKWIVPHALYRGEIYIQVPPLVQSKVTCDDMALFWFALTNLFAIDRSASRQGLEMEGIHIFSHRPSKIGRGRAKDLFGRVSTTVKSGIESPRTMDDYDISVDGNNLPHGITLTTLEL